METSGTETVQNSNLSASKGRKDQADEPGIKTSVLTQKESQQLILPLCSLERNSQIHGDKPPHTDSAETGASSQFASMLDKNPGPQYLNFPCNNSLEV